MRPGARHERAQSPERVTSMAGSMRPRMIQLPHAQGSPQSGRHTNPRQYARSPTTPTTRAARWADDRCRG